MAQIANLLPDAMLSFLIPLQLEFHTQFQVLWGDALVSESRVQAEAGHLFSTAKRSDGRSLGVPASILWVWTTAGQHGSRAGSSGSILTVEVAELSYLELTARAHSPGHLVLQYGLGIIPEIQLRLFHQPPQ